jgi:transcriptional regulator with XRE-family HTH domain
MTNEDFTEIPDELKDLFEDCPPVDEVLREWQPLEKIDWERDPIFVSEYLKAEFMNDVWASLEQQGLSQSDLAERMGWSRQYASRVLKSQMNLTIETMAKLACALGLRLSIKLHRPDERMEIVPVTRRKKNVVPLPERQKTEKKKAMAREEPAPYKRGPTAKPKSPRARKAGNGGKRPTR